MFKSKRKKTVKKQKVRDKEELFHFNFEAYQEQFKAIYEGFNLHPKAIAQFPVVLPFHLPIRDGEGFTVELNENSACTYLFSTIDTVDRFGSFIIAEASVEIPIEKTRVEMIYVTNDTKVKMVFLDCFDLLLKNLNYLIRAYLLLYKDVNVYTVSKEMFDFAIAYRIVNVEEWSHISHGFLQLHDNVPGKIKKLKRRKLNELFHYSINIQKELNPFYLSEEMMLSAKRFLGQGFYKEAVIYAQIGIESFLSALFIQLHLVKGETLAIAEKKKEELGFISMLKTTFHNQLGGKWNIKDLKSPIGQWHNNTYLLRNRVAHAAYAASFEEASAALKSAVDFRIYVVSLIRSNKNLNKEVGHYFK